MRVRSLLLALLSASAVWAGPGLGIAYQKSTLSEVFYGEGAAFGDLNRDGRVDVASGPYWYAGPDFTSRHLLYPAVAIDPLVYSENFLSFTHDFNGDGWADVLIVGFPGKQVWWLENPGSSAGLAAADAATGWKRHVVFEMVDNESPGFGDLLGNGQPVLICSTGGRLGYLQPNRTAPTQPWTFHPISPPGPWQKFTHGLGYGDLNGDGRPDLLERNGWWEQPASLAGDPVWKKHEFPFSAGRGGAQMLVTDVNGDGQADVITSLDAHGYGLSWFEQMPAAGGDLRFREHVILSPKEDERLLGGIQFSQLHALALADVDGDGLPDLITGKRWWAHGPKGDPDPNGTPVLYAFLLRRDGQGAATFEPHRIDDASGVGTQVTAADADGDGRPDILVGNKKGTFVFLSKGAAKK